MPSFPPHWETPTRPGVVCREDSQQVPSPWRLCLCITETPLPKERHIASLQSQQLGSTIRWIHHHKQTGLWAGDVLPLPSSTTWLRTRKLLLSPQAASSKTVAASQHQINQTHHNSIAKAQKIKLSLEPESTKGGAMLVLKIMVRINDITGLLRIWENFGHFNSLFNRLWPLVMLNTWKTVVIYFFNLGLETGHLMVWYLLL